jgi:hypothetical protein
MRHSPVEGVGLWCLLLSSTGTGIRVNPPFTEMKSPGLTSQVTWKADVTHSAVLRKFEPVHISLNLNSGALCASRLTGRPTMPMLS